MYGRRRSTYTFESDTYRSMNGQRHSRWGGEQTDSPLPPIKAFPPLMNEAIAAAIADSVPDDEQADVASDLDAAAFLGKYRADLAKATTMGADYAATSSTTPLQATRARSKAADSRADQWHTRLGEPCDWGSRTT